MRRVVHAMPRPVRRAFTLFELLVVIALIAVIVAVTAPAITRIVESNNYAAAVNQVSAALGNARALAMRTGNHTAVAFLYDSETNICTVQVLEQATRGTAGSLTLFSSGTASLDTLLCDPGDFGPGAAIYRPATANPPIDLPAGVVVFALSLQMPLPGCDATQHDAITPAWFAGEWVPDPDAPGELIAPWIMPRNDPRIYLDPSGPRNGDPWFNSAGALDPDEQAVRQAQSFCIQFSPDGSVQDRFSRGAASTTPNAYIEFPDRPLDQIEDDTVDASGFIIPRVPYDNPALFDPEVQPPADGEGEPNPEVMLRTASRLAIVDLKALDRDTGIERPWLLRSSTTRLQWDPLEENGVVVADVEIDRRIIELSEWIDSNAEIVGFNRFTGQALRE